MQGIGGPPVIVEAHPEGRESLLDHGVITVHHLLGVHALLSRLQQNGNPMLIRPTDEDQVPARQALVPAIDVRGEISPGEMPEMNRAVRIRQRSGDEGSLVSGIHSGGL